MSCHPTTTRRASDYGDAGKTATKEKALRRAAREYGSMEGEGRALEVLEEEGE